MAIQITTNPGEYNLAYGTNAVVLSGIVAETKYVLRIKNIAGDILADVRQTPNRYGQALFDIQNILQTYVTAGDTDVDTIGVAGSPQYRNTFTLGFEYVIEYGSETNGIVTIDGTVNNLEVYPGRKEYYETDWNYLQYEPNLNWPNVITEGLGLTDNPSTVQFNGLQLYDQIIRLDDCATISYLQKVRGTGIPAESEGLAAFKIDLYQGATLLDTEYIYNVAANGGGPYNNPGDIETITYPWSWIQFGAGPQNLVGYGLDLTGVTHYTVTPHVYQLSQPVETLGLEYTQATNDTLYQNDSGFGFANEVFVDGDHFDNGAFSNWSVFNYDDITTNANFTGNMTYAVGFDYTQWELAIASISYSSTPSQYVATAPLQAPGACNIQFSNFNFLPSWGTYYLTLHKIGTPLDTLNTFEPPYNPITYTGTLIINVVTQTGDSVLPTPAWKGHKFTIDQGICLDYDPIQFSWMNSFGTRDYFTFTKKNERSVRINRNTYLKNAVDYNGAIWQIDPTERGLTTYSQQLDQEYVANTDYISDEQAQWLESLFVSPDVRVRFSPTSEWLPVILTSSSYTQKTFRKDRLFQYELRFKLAHGLKSQRG